MWSIAVAAKFFGSACSKQNEKKHWLSLPLSWYKHLQKPLWIHLNELLKGRFAECVCVQTKRVYQLILEQGATPVSCQIIRTEFRLSKFSIHWIIGDMHDGAIYYEGHTALSCFYSQANFNNKCFFVPRREKNLKNKEFC